MKKHIVSVIIVNYNTAQLTIDCVQSILQFENNDSLEIVIVDNASYSSDYERLVHELNDFSNIKIVRSRINLGFGGGNMLGVQFTTGDFYAFINSDVLFVEPVFDSLIQFASKTDDFGVAGIQILDANQKNSISHRHFEGVRYKLFGRRFLEKTSSRYKKFAKDVPSEVDFVIGSFMFFNKEVFCKVGGFDTNIFLYYEEADICFRMKDQGKKTYFIPTLKYIHLEGQSATRNWDLMAEHWLSYFYVTRKNLGLFKYLIIRYFLLLTYLFKAPFKKKNAFVFKKMLQMNQSLAMSLKHKQKIVQ